MRTGISILLVPSSLNLSFIWNVTISNSRITWTVCFAQFCSVLFNMLPYHAYLTPPSMRVIYSICAQNGYGQHRPCKIVLLTLVAPRGVTDLYLFMNTLRTRANGLPWNLWNWVSTTIPGIVDAIHKHHIAQHVMEHSTSAPNERVLRTTQLAKLSFNHPPVVLTANVFQYINKNCT